MKKYRAQRPAFGSIQNWGRVIASANKWNTLLPRNGYRLVTATTYAGGGLMYPILMAIQLRGELISDSDKISTISVDISVHSSVITS